MQFLKLDLKCKIEDCYLLGAMILKKYHYNCNFKIQYQYKINIK